MPGLKYTVRAAALLALFVATFARPAVAAPASPSFMPGRVLVGFRSGVPPQRALDLLTAAGAHSVGTIPHIGVHIVQLPPQAGEVAAAHAFAQRPEIAFAEPDQVLPPEAVPNDPYYSSAWHLPKIACPTAWNSTTGSDSVIIAILDTGCDPTHPDLAPKYVPGWNIYDNNADTNDVYGHGTAVAGTAGAATNNGTGVAGVAWNCRIMPVRISDQYGGGTLANISSGLIWAADHGARSANISYQVSTSTTVSSAASYFQSKGGVVASSAGNEGTFTSAADNPTILTVSATDSSDALASWTNTGNYVDLGAPGVGIRTTNRGGGYGSWSGTSFSAPVVAAVAALVISANPALTASQVQDILKQSADDLGPAGWDPGYGWGRVNAGRAVNLALGASTSGADTTPPSLSFSVPTAGATVSGAISVQVVAGDDTGVASVSLIVDSMPLGTDTSGPYAFSWDTKTAVNGTHTLTATATDLAGNTASTQITLTVNNVPDTTAPTITITSPADGATANNMVSVNVNASDNVGVVKVNLYVDGTLTATSTTAPFTTKWNARKAAAGSHTLQCTVVDAAGNVGTSNGVVVSR